MNIEASDRLLSHEIRTVASRLRQGRKFRPIARLSWPDEFARQIHDRVSDWLRSGDFAQLAALLRDFPEAIAHPAVYSSLMRMRRLARHVEIAKVIGGAVIDDEPETPETCRLAGSTLHTITSALVAGLLGSQWGISPAARARGRPRRTLGEIVDAIGIEQEYHSVLEKLRPLDSKWKKHESKAQRDRRLIPVLRDVWTDTIGVTVDSEPPKPGVDLFETKIVYRAVAIPDTVLAHAIAEAADRPGRQIRRDVLAYHLVGHRWRVAGSTINPNPKII